MYSRKEINYKIYECSTFNGYHVIYSAETASKARYMLIKANRDYGNNYLTFQDVKVSSLQKSPGQFVYSGWEERLKQVNSIIRVIGSHGRCFLSENSDRQQKVPYPYFAYFKVDKRNEIWYYDRYSRKPILVRLTESWPGFSDGGTLRYLITMFASYISGVQKILHSSYIDMKHWGYSVEAMEEVKKGIDLCLQS